MEPSNTTYDYNTTRKPLLLREYGRNLQKLVETINTFPDKITRTQRAHDILKLMATLDANKKNSIDNLQKRWDDLFSISNYTLDVDGPYTKTSHTQTKENLQKPSYNKHPMRFRHYGRNVERLMRKAVSTEDDKERMKIVVSTANLMRNLGSEWNGEHIDNDTLLANMNRMVDNALRVDMEALKSQIMPAMKRHERFPTGKKSKSGTDKRLRTP